jgi:hypothetical protein
MARARNIKPAIMDNEELAELEPLTRLLFIYLWMLADREGRLEDRPKRIAVQALPYDRSADVGSMLNDLQKAGFIARYEVAGVACIQVLAFKDHQTPHVREADSSLPAYVPSTTKAVTGHDQGSDQPLPRSPDSGFSDSGLGTPAAPAPAPKARKPQKTALPDDFGISERVRTWAAAKGYGQLDEHLEAFKRKARAKAYTYANWDEAFMEAIREDWAKLRGRAANGSAPPPESVPSDEAKKTAAYLKTQEREPMSADERAAVAARLRAQKANLAASKLETRQ